MNHRAALLPFLLTACAQTPAPPANVGDAVRQYLRADRDGSTPEHIVYFRPAPPVAGTVAGAAK